MLCSVSSSAVPSVFSEKAAGWVKESGKVIFRGFFCVRHVVQGKDCDGFVCLRQSDLDEDLSAGMRVPVPSSK